MNNIQIFKNNEFGAIRTQIINDEPWFVGRDVAESLGYAEPSSAISKKVDAEDKGVAKMETPSGKQKVTIINESGLYSLIFGSKLEPPSVSNDGLLLKFSHPSERRVVIRNSCPLKK